MTILRFTDRSRVEVHLRCARRRWLEYEESGTGIQPSRKALALVVGGAVHRGLEVLLRLGAHIYDHYNGGPLDGQPTPYSFPYIEEEAVKAALADFSQFAGKLEGDDAPTNLVQIATDPFNSQLAAQAIDLGLDPAAFRGPSVEERRGRADAYLYAEQSALVEAMVRAYARRRLRPLLEEFEVLEVEREGEWVLARWQEPSGVCLCGQEMDRHSMLDNHSAVDNGEEVELRFLSRPDALLRHRRTNELQILSFKTTGQWDMRKARDIQHDMQGLSEGVEIERRLASWWEQIQSRNYNTTDWNTTTQFIKWLEAQPAPPRVSAIRYEFLLKGERWKDRDLTARLGVDSRIQKSHLIYQYAAVSTPAKGKNSDAFRIGDVCWSWDFTRPEDQSSSKLAAANWRPRAVWEGGSGAVREWIDRLDRSELLMSGEDTTVGMAPRALGWRSDAQAMGVTESHPLDSVFVPPVTISRQDDHLRDWAEQVAELERRNAEAAMRVAAAKDAGEKRSLLNRLFPQTRNACEYPGTCPFARDRVGICWGGDAIQSDPLGVGAGEYVRRVPNHPREGERAEGEHDAKV